MVLANEGAEGKRQVLCCTVKCGLQGPAALDINPDLGLRILIANPDLRIVALGKLLELIAER